MLIIQPQSLSQVVITRLKETMKLTFAQLAMAAMILLPDSPTKRLFAQQANTQTKEMEFAKIAKLATLVLLFTAHQALRIAHL